MPAESVSAAQNWNSSDLVVGFGVRCAIRYHIGHTHLMPHFGPIEAQVMDRHLQAADFREKGGGYDKNLHGRSPEISRFISFASDPSDLVRGYPL